MRRPGPVPLHWSSVVLVFVGGALGTAVRYLVSIVVSPAFGLPLATFGINVLGAFVLGWLLEALARRGPDAGLRRSIRLGFGTGVLGGFTTYSAFVVDTDGLIVAHNFGGSAVYAVAMVAVGALASVAGIAVGAAFDRRRAGRRRPEPEGMPE